MVAMTMVVETLIAKVAIVAIEMIEMVEMKSAIRRKDVARIMVVAAGERELQMMRSRRSLSAAIRWYF
jgi:hypothetical protein